MRIPRALAWLLVGMGLFTAGLLRQFHDLTPASPFLAPIVGSLLFACVLFLFLVAARERQIGAAPGVGLRLGSLTPLLLMLLLEKWVSSGFYAPLFALLAPRSLSDASADAWFRLLCGVGLGLIVILASRFSRPAAAWVAARLFGRTAVIGILSAVAAIVAAGATVAAIGLAFGAPVHLAPAHAEGPIVVVVLGQAVIALAEETFYRGLVLGEILRLMPRLGVGSPPLRRWLALGMTSVLFGMEHMGVTSGWDDATRRLVFAMALGALLGMTVLLTDNLWFSACLHAWVNWGLLGAVPSLAFGPARTELPPGAAISLVMISAFVTAFVLQRTRVFASRGR